MKMSCAFQSDATYYASVSNPAETLAFSWNCETGIPAKLEWWHGDVLWYLHADPGQITQQGYYYDIDLRITTAAHQETSRCGSLRRRHTPIMALSHFSRWPEVSAFHRRRSQATQLRP